MCRVSYPAFGGGGRILNPELRPSPGYHEGSSGHVVAQRWLRCGDTCHQARLAFGSTVQTICAGAWATGMRRPTSTAAKLGGNSLWSEREPSVKRGPSTRGGVKTQSRYAGSGTGAGTNHPNTSVAGGPVVR